MDNIKEASQYLKTYWNTYQAQIGYESYSIETFLHDAVYGIGAAISDDYRMGEGYEKFKADLIEFLQSGDWNSKEEEK